MLEPYDSDESLVEGLRRREEVAIAVFLKRYGRRMKAFLKAMPWAWSLSAQDIEEILSEATYRIARSVASFDPAKGRFTTWIFSIVQNVGLDRLRDAQFQFEEGTESYEDILETTGRDVAVDESEPSVESHGPKVARLSRGHIIAREALKCLTPVEQRVLTEHMYGLANPEIAKLLGKSDGAVRTALSRAKERFRTECLRICEERGIDPHELQC